MLSKNKMSPKELEVDLRTAGCDQIQLAGRILKQPQANAYCIFLEYCNGLHLFWS